MEHRWGRRQPTDLKVRVASTDKIGSGRLLNISMTGAFVATRMPLRLLSVVYVASSSSRRVRTSGMAAFVVRRDADGVGLEWCEALQDGLGVVARLALLTNNDVEAPAAALQPLPAESRPRHAAQAYSRR
jgi:PilZ domain